jgi:hypothetical protein
VRSSAGSQSETAPAGRLVAGFRGAAPADSAALVDLLLRLGRLADDLPEVAELDLNPILADADADADGCVVVDARIRIRAPARERRLKLVSRARVSSALCESSRPCEPTADWEPRAPVMEQEASLAGKGPIRVLQVTASDVRSTGSPGVAAPCHAAKTNVDAYPAWSSAARTISRAMFEL